MKPQNFQYGFSHIAILLVIVILGGIGITGWKVYETNNAVKQPEPANVSIPVVKQNELAIPKGFVEYKNEELGFKFAYPKEWGSVVIADGEDLPFGEGNIFGGGESKQATFSGQSKVNIKFIKAGFGTALDGCPPALDIEQARVADAYGSTIGWEGNNLKLLHGLGAAGSPEAESQLGAEKLITSEFIATGSTKEGMQRLSTVGKVIVYKGVNRKPWKAVSRAGEASCEGTGTQAEIDNANAYQKLTYYALNFTTKQFKGVSAVYDSRQSFDQSLSDQIVETLNTLTNL